MSHMFEYVTTNPKHDPTPAIKPESKDTIKQNNKSNELLA
jgi:hypothetical protein